MVRRRDVEEPYEENKLRAPQCQEKSKSQLKREMEARRNLGKALVALSAARLAKIPLSDETRNAVEEGQRLKKGALKRHLSRIASLLTEFDDEAEIRAALDRLYQPHREEVRLHREVEQWRAALIAGDAELMQQLCERFESLDRQHLHQLIRNARRERDQHKPPRSARALYRYLHGFMSDD